MLGLELGLENEHFPRFEDSGILNSLFMENCSFGPGLDAPELEMSLIAP